jgi:PAS domain S-box-containing protein
MATILIVDDRQTNREYLLTLLNYSGHRLLEAADGAEALVLTRLERPDLVIADILMPTMDGYEFVRQLRADPAIAQTRVIFCTAHYHEQEANSLAKSCGVAGVLTKPCEPEVVLRMVNAVLGDTPPVVEEDLTGASFDREHLRLITDKLSEKAEELRRTNERLTALVELNLQLGSEHDPARLLQGFAQAAREIIGARYSIVAVANGEQTKIRYCFASGMDSTALRRLGMPESDEGSLGLMLKQAKSQRGQNPSGDPAAAGFARQFPPIYSWVGSPVRSPSKTYGWVLLIDKLGAESFGDEDERLAGILAAQVGRIYENGSLYTEVVRQSAELNLKVIERGRAEKRFRALIESAPDAMVIIDGSGAMTIANERTEDLFGYPRAELIGHPVELLIPDRYRERSIAARQPFLSDPTLSPTGEVMELFGRRKDGSEFPVEINLSPLQTEEGVVVTIVIRDISSRKRNEEALRASEELLRSAFEYTNVAMALTDTADRFVRVNAAFSQMFGYSKAELLQMTMKDITHPDHMAESDGRRLELLSGKGHFFQIEKRYIHKDKHLIWALVNLSLVRSVQGQPFLYVRQVQDITERKKTETDLYETQKRLEHVLSSNPAVIYTLAVEGNRIRGISWISDNVREMVGYTAEEAREGNWWFGNIHPEDHARVRENIHRTLPAQGHAMDEYRFRHRNGSYRWVRSEMRLLRDSQGDPVEVVGSMSDITERKHLEDQILQAQKMEAIGKLAGGIAHDFNNLLTVINGYCELLIGSIPPANSMREPLDEILNAGSRAASLTRQLLAFSRKAVLAPLVLDLNELIRNLQKMLSRLIGEDIELKVILDPAVWKVKVDPGQMEQIIMNLVVNARDAMPRGGKLIIETANIELDEAYANKHPETQPGDYVRVAVSDTGFGMDAATQARIFEPFFTTKGPDKGTGLGLSVVHGIVKQSGGRVEVYSEVGLGATFKIYLPRASDHTPSSNLVATTPSRGGKETILLVEDEAGVRSLARMILERHGYTVLEATNGEEAITLTENFPGIIDIVVTDTVMPKMSGTQLIRHLATTRPTMKVLYISGYTDDAVVHHGIIDPDTPFLQKPFTSEALANKVRELLDL